MGNPSMGREAPRGLHKGGPSKHVKGFTLRARLPSRILLAQYTARAFGRDSLTQLAPPVLNEQHVAACTRSYGAALFPCAALNAGRADNLHKDDHPDGEDIVFC